jgi:hypothetical protein
VPAAERLRASVEWIWSKVRRSIPLRTVLFLLPPLVLPPLAFDLSLAATVVVALTLLWLAGAAAVFSVMMLEGGDHLAQRSIEHRLERGNASDDTLQEALATISRQLDALDERVTSLPLAADTVASDPPVDDPTAALSHRPQEQWSTGPSDGQYDLYGQPAVADTNFAEPGSTRHAAEPSAQDWSESRWRR